MAAFLATLALLVFQMSSGHDPALGIAATPATLVATTSGASPVLRTTTSGATLATPPLTTQRAQTVAARAGQTVSLVTRTSGSRSQGDDG